MLTQLGASFKVFELDEMSKEPKPVNSNTYLMKFELSLMQIYYCYLTGDGGEIQAALSEWTGQSTVPNVFIKGKHIGGCDSKRKLNKLSTP